MGVEVPQTSSGLELALESPKGIALAEIESHPKPCCYLCGSSGNVVYRAVKDQLFGSPGTWDFKLCSDPDCGLLWLDPAPTEGDIAKAYARYYTHTKQVEPAVRSRRLLRRCMSKIFSWVNPVHKEREQLSLMYLFDKVPGKLLDVGCGNGERLARLRALGWDVQGQDIDPAAVASAREIIGVDARLGRLEDIPFPKGAFDCVILNHVIEHVHDPIALLRECRCLLKTDGLIVVVTPNSKSFARRYFGEFWRGLEPPRHIHLFSPEALCKVAETAGFSVRELTTTVANSRSFGYSSHTLKNRGLVPSTARGKVSTEIRNLWFFYRSFLEHSRDASCGEECVLRGIPRDSRA